MANRIPFSREQYFDAKNNAAFEGAKMYTFATKTNTKKQTFTDASEDTPRANPIVSDANGIFPEIYGVGEYKIRIFNNDDSVLLFESDPISGVLAASVDNVGVSATFQGILDTDWTGFDNIQSLSFDAVSGGSSPIGDASFYRSGGPAGTPSTSNLAAGLCYDSTGSEFKLVEGQDLNQSKFGVSGQGYPTNEGPALNDYATYCRTNNRQLVLDDNGSRSIIYTSETINFEDIDVIGNRPGVYSFGVVVSDGLGWGVLTGIPSGRPPVADVYNSEDRKPKTGICILSDTVTDIVHISTARTYTGFGITGWLELSGQRPLSQTFAVAYKGVRIYLRDISVTGSGGDGIVLPNGIEVSDWYNVNSFMNNGYGVTTAGGGGDSNQEYLHVRRSAFTLNRLDGFVMENFKKGVKFEFVNGTSNGWYGFGVNAVGKPADQSNVRGMLRIEGNVLGSSILEIENCLSEDSGRMVTALLDSPLRAFRFHDNYLIPTIGLSDTNNDLLWIESTGSGQIRDFDVGGNAIQDAARGQILVGDMPVANIIDINIDEYQTTSYDLELLNINRATQQTFKEQITLDKHVQVGRDVIGDGTAGVFISQYINDNLRVGGQGNNSYSVAACFLLTANWQATNADAGGAYLLYAFKTAAGNVKGEAQAIGAGVGFTVVPTIALNGDLSVELDESYRASITRIDMSGTLA